MIRPTKLKDVAKAAGVSQGTASNAFNRPELVRPELRERVEAAARNLSYSGPDPKGRLLRAGKFNAIGVVMPAAAGIPLGFTHPYMRDFLAGVAEVCEEQGAGLTLVSGVDDRKGWGIGNALVDGFIFGQIEEIELIEPAVRRKLPFVVMDIDGGPDISSVRIDDRDAARQAAQHLVDLGHRRFAVLTVLRQSGRAPIFHGPAEAHHELAVGYRNDHDRLNGIADVLAGVGISIDDVPIVEVFGGAAEGASFGGAAEGALMLLDNAPEATAVIALEDTQELAVLSGARRGGIIVPRDLSVVGFDNPPEAARTDPPLTTIVPPTVEKGRVAARILFEGGPPRQVVLPVKLVVRSSTAPPRTYPARS